MSNVMCKILGGTYCSIAVDFPPVLQSKSDYLRGSNLPTPQIRCTCKR